METRVLLVLILLAPAASAQSLLPRQPEDLRAEWANDPADANGLPASAPGVILDSRALTYAGGGDARLGFRFGVPVNEWVVPLVFSDPETGARTRSFLTPGLVRFHAWYGTWNDLDGARDVDSRTDAANEWQGRNSGDPGVVGLVGFVRPGYHPSVTSDHYLLAEGVGAEDSTPPAPDFEYSSRGKGEWISSHTILFREEFLLQEIEVTTAANALGTGGEEPGYTCENAFEACRVDIDRYDVLNTQLAGLFLSTIESTTQTAQPALDVVAFVAQEANEASAPTLLAARGAAFTNASSEVDETHPYASMTAAHGAPRDPGGYSYASQPHAFLDLTLRAYWTDATGFVVSTPAHGVPAADARAQGAGPMLLAVDGLAGVWGDAGADGIRGRGEFVPTCAVVGGGSSSPGTGGAPGSGTSAGTTPEIEVGWQNHPSDSSAGLAITGVLEAVDDAGVPTTWGPTGVYVLRDEDGPVDGVVQDDVAWDMVDTFPHRRVTEGPIAFALRCDDDDPGSWSSAPWYGGTFLLMPAGNAGFNIRLTMDAGYAIRFQTSAGQFEEAVRDVDWVDRWA